MLWNEMNCITLLAVVVVILVCEYGILKGINKRKFACPLHHNGAKVTF